MHFFSMQHSHLRLLIPLIVCLWQNSLFAQTVTFQKAIGGPGNDIAYDILETADGYLLAGESEDTATSRSVAVLIRTDKQGAVLWQKQYDQFDSGGFYRVATANDGGFIAWGALRNYNVNHTDAVLVKLDDAGNLIWHKIIGETGFSEFASGQIISMPDGYILSGEKTKPGYFQSFVTRVNNDGETIWSQFTPSSYYNALRAAYVADSLLYLTGTANGFGCLRSMHVATGQIVQTQEYRTDTIQVWAEMHRSNDGNHVMAGQLSRDLPGLVRINGWVQKVDPDGQPVWSKSYKIGDLNWFNAQAMLPDGSSVASLSYFPMANGSSNYSALLRISAEGDLLWANDMGDAILTRIITTADGGWIAVGRKPTDSSGFGGIDMFMVKMDSLGIVQSCCTVVPDVTVKDVPVTLRLEPFSISGYENMLPLFFATQANSGLLSTDICIREQPVLQQTITFCPGETVSVGGVPYAQPGTVTEVLPSTTGGCDTIATYVLEYQTANEISDLQLNCPADIITVATAGASSAVVSYAQPTASSTCSCPEMALDLTAGNPSGSPFAAGVTQVCYRAQDACGSTKTCCFNISVETVDDEVCDTKTIGCMEFTLQSIRRYVNQKQVYRIRITNHCSAELNYAYIQVPDGIQAAEPANNSLFAASGSSNYLVRNPNFSPFYSVRFKPAATGIANGQSDVFRYVLPAQSDPDYIHVAVRLASGVFYETHLNTFFCPVGAELQPLADRTERNQPAPEAALSVYPNPASGASSLRIAGGDILEGMFVLQDPSGKRVRESRIESNLVLSDLRALADGLYFFKVFANGQFTGSGKLVLGR